MTTVSDFVPGGYSFLPSVFQYSAGVAALPGYEIQRVRFRNPLPLGDGFDFGLRTAIADSVHRRKFSGLQRKLCCEAADLGPGRRHRESCGAQQCVPGDQSAFSAELSRLRLYD